MKKILVMIIALTMTICFASCGEETTEDSVENETTEAKATINMDDQKIDGSDAKALMDAVSKSKDVEWEKAGFTDIGESLYLGEYRITEEGSSLSTVKVTADITAGKKDVIWDAEIKQLDSDGDYDIFYDAVEAVKNDAIENEKVKEWLDENINESPAEGEWHSVEMQSGDATYELAILGSQFQGNYNKDITLTIKGVGYDSYIEDKV